MRFSISGRTQYLIVDLRFWRAMKPACVGARANISSADSAAEFPPPTITRAGVVHVRLRVIVVDVRQVLAGHADHPTGWS